MTYERIFAPLTDRAIQLIEQAFKINLPADYAAYLKQFNGGFIEPNNFAIQAIKNQSSLSVLYGIKTNEELNHLDLVDKMRSARRFFPKGYFPIGHDPGGNTICLSVDTSDYGKIYFWNHEDTHGEIPSVKDLILIADSFTDFLTKLY